MKILQLMLPLLALTFTACHPVPRPIEGREDPYGRRQIMFSSTELENDTSVGKPEVSRDDGNILFITVPVTATGSRPLNLEYRVTFYDEHGGVTNQTTWLAKRLTPRVTDSISVNSTSSHAADFQIDFREGK